MAKILNVLLLLVMISCRDSTTLASPEAQDEEITTEVYMNIINYRLQNGRNYPTSADFISDQKRFLGKWNGHKFAYYIGLIDGKNVPVLIHLSSISKKGHLVFVMFPERRISFLVDKQGLEPIDLNDIKAEILQKVEAN